MMKRETKRRIAYYQDALPDMKKRVFAAALMLMIAVIVSITATYAWVTLSVAPVVSSVNTTMSANGALEIALSPDDGSQPQEYDIDESVTHSSDVKISNLRWGNLINLSDTAYGLQEMVLRPAQLNTASKESPLQVAAYGTDGRVDSVGNVSSDTVYTYAKWDETREKFQSAVEENQRNHYGVSAIASGKMDESAVIEDPIQNTLANEATAAHNAVNTAYKEDVPKKMSGMDTMLSKFAASKLDGKEAVFSPGEITAAYELYKAVYEVMEKQKDAYVALANLQSYIYAKNNATAYTPVEWSTLAGNPGGYESDTQQGGPLVGLTQFVADLNTAFNDANTLKAYSEGSENIVWSDINGIVSNMIHYSDMTLLLNGEEKKLTSLGASDAFSLLGGTKTVYIYNGILKRFEQLAITEDARMSEKNKASVTITVMNIPIKGVCYTKAKGPSDFALCLDDARNQKIIGGNVDILDTYGMAVDFWLRTNAEKTYLTLEGATVTDEEGNILSYDGVNRVWGSTGNLALTTNSTTQGGGSSYIFYADTPADQNRALASLEFMRVAFFAEINGEHTLLATASMDKENCFAVNGRVTVPLVIAGDNNGTTYSFTDEEGETQVGRAITKMTYDDAMRITAIIYLAGTEIHNDAVLAASDIEGQLNIQFGSSENLNTVGDNELLTAERIVSAELSHNSFDMATAEDASDLTTNVTVTVNGNQPDAVTAYFVREINATQGERQKSMTFTKQDETSETSPWIASHTFDAPGTYYLRHVRLDGVDYTLETPLRVEVKGGFSVANIRWNQVDRITSVYSVDNRYEITLGAQIASESPDKKPTAVQAVFMSENGEVRVPMTLGSGNEWSGTAEFGRSGVYTLSYFEIDNENYDVSEEEFKLSLSLGLHVVVENNGSKLTDDEFTEESAAEKEYYKKVAVDILDDSDSIPAALLEMNNAEDDTSVGKKTIHLFYSRGGSSTDTVYTELEWDETLGDGRYSGVLPIMEPGTYIFHCVMIGTDVLNRGNDDAPVYKITNHKPTKYITSESEYCAEKGEVQYVPLATTALIGPIKFENSGTADFSAEVKDEAGNIHTITQTVKSAATPGTMYVDGTIDKKYQAWYILLPLRSDETQEGTWEVVSISAYNCYDENDVYHASEKDPVVWTGDFSMLKTVVSSSVEITMESGKTELGGTDTPFMNNNYVRTVGMSVQILDGKGDAIPADKISSVVMNVTYNGNADVNRYGYEVSLKNQSYDIKFVSAQNNGVWTVDTDTSNFNWQYVGIYKVNSLIVTTSGGTKTINPGHNGVPTQYTVTSAAPTLDNIEITNVRGESVFGMTDGTVNGAFLQSYGGDAVNSPLAAMSVRVTPAAEGHTVSYASIPGFSLSLKLTYQDENKAPNGGYEWAEDVDTGYSDLTLEMLKNDTTYFAEATPLLAGTYKREVILKINDKEVDFSGNETIANALDSLMNEIEVYSVRPSLTVSEHTERVNGYVLKVNEVTTSYTKSTYPYGFDKNWSGDVSVDFESNGYISSTNTCTVYIPVTETTRDSRKALFFNSKEPAISGSNMGLDSEEVCPKIRLSLSMLNEGLMYEDITGVLVGNYEIPWTIKAGTWETESITIGKVSENWSRDTYQDGSGCNAKYYWGMNRTVFGTAEVERIDVPCKKADGSTCVYTMTLEKKLTISNPY